MPAFGGPGDRDPQPLPQPFPLPAPRRSADLLGQWPNDRERAGHHVLRDIALVGKVDPGLDQRQRLDQSLPPGLGALPEHPLELPQRLPALRFGLGRDQIGEPLDRGQVERGRSRTRGG